MYMAEHTGRAALMRALFVGNVKCGVSTDEYDVRGDVMTVSGATDSEQRTTHKMFNPRRTARTEG